MEKGSEIYIGETEGEPIMSLYDLKPDLGTAMMCSRTFQACMRLANTDNLQRLKQAFPTQWSDLRARYNAPGGMLPGDSREIERERR